MKIEIDIAGPWVINGARREFYQGQRLIVGECVPEKIAEEMLKHSYAHKIDEMPRIETKTHEQDSPVINVEQEKKSQKKRGRKKKR